MILTASFVDVDFMPDGNLDKAAWSQTAKVHFDRDAFKGAALPQLETTVASLWSAQYLYLAYWCKYTALYTYEGEDPAAQRWQLWDRDVVEAFIAPQPNETSHYYEFEVAPNNQWIDLEIHCGSEDSPNAQWNSHFLHATRIDAPNRIWTAEMRIPCAPMGAAVINENTEWRMNLYRADGRGPDAERNLMCWNPLPLNNGSFHQPASFGTLRFARRA
jgi:alpha-galactosidase